MAFRSDGALVFIDNLNYIVKAILPPLINGTRAVPVIGLGIRGTGGDGGPALACQLDDPNGLLIDPNDDMFVIDYSSNTLRKVTKATGIITLVTAALPPLPSTLRVPNLLAINVQLKGPRGVSITQDNNIYIADATNNAVRILYANGTIGLAAGTGLLCINSSAPCGDGGLAIDASFDFPYTIGVAKDGGFFIGERKRVRYVNTVGRISTAISASQISSGSAITISTDGSLYLYDTSNYILLKYNVATKQVQVVAGTRGMKGYQLDPSPANQALFGTVWFISPGPNNEIYLADVDYGLVYKYDPGLALVTRIAFTLWDANDKPPLVFDGIPALNATAEWPTAVAVDSAGNIFIVVAYDYVIRRVSPDGIIHTLAGTGVPAMLGDGGPASQASLNIPRGITIDAYGNIFFSESASARVREITTGSGQPNCPAGYSCTCGLRPAACSDPSTFCPLGTVTPISASPGFFTIGSPVFGSSTALAHYAQKRCPTGAFCFAGITNVCPAGTYGVSPGEPYVSSCIACPVGTYLAEAGTPASPGSPSPCLPCPAGTSSSTAGASFCVPCAAMSMGVGGSAGCQPCPANSWSLVGSATCVPLDASDQAFAVGALLSFQREEEFDDGNMSDENLKWWYKAASVPVFFIFFLPLLIVLLYKAKIFPGSVNHVVFVVLFLLRRNDLFCDLAHPTDKGTSPMRQPTPLGGGCSVAALGVFMAFSFAVTLQFFFANTIAVFSLLPLSYAESAAIATYPPFSLSQFSAAASAVDLSPMLPYLDAGLNIYISSSGRYCFAPLAVNQATSAGTFTNSSFYNVSTGQVTHVFSCPDCFVDELSFLTVAFNSSCAQFVVSAAAVGAWGAVSSWSFAAFNASKINASFAIRSESSLDFVQGKDPHHTGYPTGGRSYRGLGVTSLAVSSITPYSPPISYADARGRVTTISLGLPASPFFSRQSMTPALTILQLLSSLVGNLGVLGGATVAFSWYLFFVDKTKTIRAGKPLFTIFGPAYRQAMLDEGLKHFSLPPTKVVRKTGRTSFYKVRRGPSQATGPAAEGSAQVPLGASAGAVSLAAAVENPLASTARIRRHSSVGRIFSEGPPRL
jgi:hypothetical protein